MTETISIQKKRIRNRIAQRKFSQTEKGKKYIKEKNKKWLKKKKKINPEYFKKFYKNEYEKRKEYFKAYQAKRRVENPEKVKKLAREAQKRFYKTEKGKKYFKEKFKKWLNEKRKTDPEYFKKYYKNEYDRRKEYFKAYQTKLRRENPEKAKEQSRRGMKKFYQKTKKIPKYIILRALRKRLGFALNAIKQKKKVSTLNLLGCSIEKFKEYIEIKFKNGMNWENYGKWHIDHIKPIAKFDLNVLEEQKECFHYTNLQPLWAIENIKKGSKITPLRRLKI